MDYTITEMEILLKLKELRKQGKQIHLQLRPDYGHSTIDTEGTSNRLFINEGRDGMYYDITELFFDRLVVEWDSRMPQVKQRVNQTMRLH
jgi:hypothetical protein